ncbi:SA1362 family protein [Thermaerobacillus caldiproteolyticus]|uniref:Putative membrane protein YfcA n=1 Tax=Thermaerobacillus caldiproteolyticus TaxID=247480 RepID=A0A7V9Z3P2_9BACL|nr:SA1362 family protein [Anoxybacillus caldiproteolyticus]MBA2873436.1 putative membrane protein YfcA [Anoxybacillus caldiproteolyticus]QPA30023.1 hypothetical protein ISX45_10145 [Anoxybacillus caldiproteolyticus]
MRRRTIHPFAALILFLGAFGFVYVLWEHPATLFRRILFISFAIVAIYALYQLLYKRRMNKEHTSYLKAVHQSKKLHPDHRRKTQLKAKRLSKKRTTTHLTVIEGKKGKKKNRALF